MPTLDVQLYDLTHTLLADLSVPAGAARVWDEIHAVATLQGIVNRDAPRLYLRYVEYAGRNIDDWWLEMLRRSGEWLAGVSLHRIDSLEKLVNVFRDRIAGAVVYDPHVPATSNVASTVAGVEDLIAVRFDETPGSVYDRLIRHGPGIPVKQWLVSKDGASMFNPVGGPTGSLREPGDSLEKPGDPLEKPGDPLGELSVESAKCQAYLWAKREFVDTGRCDPRFLGDYIDSFWINHAGQSVPNHHTLTNHDYFVAKRAFFCDLNCWGDETPVDDPSQSLGADLETLQAILRSLHRRSGGAMIHVGGFTPWAFKYTDQPGAGGTRGGVDTEWELVRIVSAHNGFLDADAIALGAMANASFFMHYPLDKRYAQAPRPTTETLRAQGYVGDTGRVDADGRDYLMFYVGDYDSAAWLYQRVPDLWEDRRRGEVPMSWAISPIVERRAPMAMAHMWRTQSANDAFMAADNGAGYLNPSMLTEPRPISGLPGGLDAWAEHCRAHYRRWDMNITGFVIDGHAPPMNRAALDAYATFSPDGIVPQKTEAEVFLHRGMPVMRCGPDIVDEDPPAAAETILKHIEERCRRGLRFHWFRAILKSPSWYADAVAELRRHDPGIEVVTAPVFFELLRRHQDQTS